jgi:hypothetical protein
MTTIAATPLSETLRRLVDARLDTIDRMLLGRVNRQDRLAIVREVESQIHDLLQDRDPGSLDREDVLAVLTRLDPPEAYLPEEQGESSTAAWPTSIPMTASRERGARTTASPIPGIVGLVAIGMVFVAFATYILAEMLGSEMLFLVGSTGAIGLAFLLGVIATSLAMYMKLRGAWAVVGLVTGIIATVTALLGGVTILAVFSDQ